jgi:hypothetical protein
VISYMIKHNHYYFYSIFLTPLVHFIFIIFAYWRISWKTIVGTNIVCTPNFVICQGRLYALQPSISGLPIGLYMHGGLTLFQYEKTILFYLIFIIMYTKVIYILYFWIYNQLFLDFFWAACSWIPMFCMPLAFSPDPHFPVIYLMIRRAHSW